ncbi:TPM domain-containing protein [Xanthobacter sediminis]
MSYVATAMQAPAASAEVLSPEAIGEISEAIAAAELQTSAEMRVVVSRASLVQHPFFSVMWSSLISLVLPWAVLAVWPMSALSILQVQAILFLVVAGVLMLPKMTERAVPRLALKAAARSAAIEAFLAHGVSQTDGRTGLLIFVAARERLVEVVADEGVQTPVGPVAWAEICDVVSRQARQGTLGDGLVASVRKAGELLSGPLPPRPGDVNELTDRVIII